MSSFPCKKPLTHRCSYSLFSHIPFLLLAYTSSEWTKCRGNVVWRIETILRRNDLMPHCTQKNIKELKQRRRWRRWLRKLLLKSEFALLQSQSCLVNLGQLVKCWQFFSLYLNSKRRYQSSGNEKESRCLVFVSPTKREIRPSRVVLSRGDGKEMYKKVRSRCRLRRRWLSNNWQCGVVVSWSTPEKDNTCAFHRGLWNGSVDVHVVWKIVGRSLWQWNSAGFCGGFLVVDVSLSPAQLLVLCNW